MSRLPDDDYDADSIVMPLYTLTIEYGLTADGTRLCTEKSIDHANPDLGIPRMEKIGMLGMVEHGIMTEPILDLIREHLSDDEGDDQ